MVLSWSSQTRPRATGQCARIHQGASGLDRPRVFPANTCRMGSNADLLGSSVHAGPAVSVVARACSRRQPRRDEKLDPDVPVFIVPVVVIDAVVPVRIGGNCKPLATGGIEEFDQAPRVGEIEPL